MERVRITDPESCSFDGDQAVLCALIGESVLTCQKASSEKRRISGLRSRGERLEELKQTIASSRADVEISVSVMSENFGLSEPCTNARLRRCSLAMACEVLQQQMSK